MDLNPAVVISVAVGAVAVLFVLVRWRRGEAAAPVDRPAPHPQPVRSNTMAAREGRENEPLVTWLLERAAEQTGVPVANDAMARQRLAEAAAKSTDVLRAGGTATINLPFLTADPSGPKHFTIEFKRNANSTFEVVG
jgi:hypothetical protein